MGGGAEGGTGSEGGTSYERGGGDQDMVSRVDLQFFGGKGVSF